MISVLIGGDLCPIGMNMSLFQEGDIQALFSDLLPEFEKADLSIVNLECSLIREETPIEKSGPILGVPEACINGLKAAGIDVANLANNHIMDHGPQGLRSTIETCRRNGIDYVGVGENLQEARRICVWDVKGMRIGVLSLAEHEFNIASKNTPGANPLDVIDFVRNVDAHRSKFDYLLVLLHGGTELYPYPRPELMDMCRFLVEQGANAVICQQSHCPGCLEFYRGAPIVYGQGNLLFDWPSTYKSWHEGVLLSLKIGEGGHSHLELIPFIQSDGRPGARRMTKGQEEQFRKNFEARSRAINEESFVEEQWHAFCEQQKRFYLHLIHGRWTLIRRVAGKLNLLRYFDSKEVHLNRLEAIRCESHREALITVLSMELSQQRKAAKAQTAKDCRRD